MSRLLLRSGLRSLLRHPWQIGLAALGVALGVAVVVSIDVANRSAERAFDLSTEAVAGRATHQVLGGPTGLPESVYRALRVELGVREAAPVVEGDVAAPAFPGRAFRLLGVDPFAERPFRPYLDPAGPDLEVGPLLTRPGAAVLAAGTAAELGLDPGDTVALRVGAERRAVTIAGLLEPADEMSRRALESMIVVDIATAQEVLGAAGRLSRIDLIVPDGARGEALLARIRDALPPGAEVVRAEARAEAVEGMTRAFRVNLSALSSLALVFGMFLIYNSMTFSVVRRRTLFGTLRALGVTRREVVALVLGEALVVGIVGTVAGSAAGVALGRGLVALVTRTINDLYFTLSVRGLAVPVAALAKGAALGIGATVLAGLAPAFEATTVPPRAALTRSHLEDRVRRAVPRAATAGAALVAAGAALLALPTAGLGLGFAALFAVLIGAALLTPAATVLLVRGARPVLAALLGLQGGMAARGVVASLSRTAPAIAALVIAISVTVGLGTMIGSFRTTVERWLDRTLQADIYVAAPAGGKGRTEPPLDPALVERLATTPGVAGVTTYRGAVVESEAGAIRLLALRMDPRTRAAFSFLDGDADTVWPAFEAGAVLVSEPFAYRHGLGAGDRLRLRTDRGTVEFPVAGVFRDYGTDQGVVMLSRGTYDRHWDDPAVSSLALFAASGVDVDDLVGRLRDRVGAGQEVLIRSNRALREASLEVFDRTFAITAVLRLLAFVVAFIGVLSALMAVQLERARELAVLRAQGLAPGELWRLILGQTGLTGLIAGILSIPLGVAVAAVMVFVVNRRSFGWTIDLVLSPEALGQAVGIAVVAAVLAGLYPAHRMAATPPALALREE